MSSLATSSSIVRQLGRYGVWLLFFYGSLLSAHGHEGFAHFHAPQQTSKDGGVEVDQSNHAFRLFTTLVSQWPLPCREDLIAQAYLEHQFLHDDPAALDWKTLQSRRREMIAKLTALIPTYRVRLGDDGIELIDSNGSLSVCEGIRSIVLIQCVNQIDRPMAFRAAMDFDDPSNLATADVSPNAETVIACTVSLDQTNDAVSANRLQIEISEGDSKHVLSIPIRTVKPARLRLRLTDIENSRLGKTVAGRITVQCSDGVCRHGGLYASKSTFTDKPIIYPPVGTWQKLPFFYSDQQVEMDVPPGPTRVTFERGFEHLRKAVDAQLKPGETLDIETACDRMENMFEQGWVSGDTHVHWVTNAWNVDEPLELLSMAQRAEDLRVANNLTLLQRYANQAFVKPSQAPMGPIREYSSDRFHMQMGEEYRNEDLYGHLCLLNIDWLVQPIGTGSIIAGPDALDYPLNRTAIEACRIQGGISIEAHGTGGNKDVPVNVIHRLTDSLDQIEPEMYYRLLDCGFQLPLTNGSDHPARTLGIARAYVRVDGDFTYDRWIDGIRKGRTFTTSGPLLFFQVNDANIGDVVSVDATDRLRITARAISRDPIGTFQIVSNGKILYSHETNDTEFQTELTLSAEESRWFIARCSYRKDGRSDFGFGNFNAITGPGVAHTSPIYIQVNGMPRFDPMAADFWKDRMRIHANDIRGRGRFADERQREEAVHYIEQGIEMFQDLKSQVLSSRSKAETFEQTQRRLSHVIRRFGKTDEQDRILKDIEYANSIETLHDAIAPLVLLNVSIHSHSHGVVESKRQRLDLQQGRPQRYLIAIDNQAGVQGRIQINATDPSIDSSNASSSLGVEIIDSPFISSSLTGARTEYKVVEFYASEGGRQKLQLDVSIEKAANLELAKLELASDEVMVDVKWRRNRPFKRN